jgi:hypothetical protein
MNYKVRTYTQPIISKLKKDKYILENDIEVVLKEGNYGYVVRIYIKAGAIWDGLSVPFMFRWFLPNYSIDNPLLNVAGLVHDGMYASELVAKDTADDMFRGIMRDAGISRFKASTAEFLVEQFASKHYGIEHDKHNLRKYIDMTVDSK